MRLLLLLGLLALASAAPVITSVNNPRFRTLRPDAATGAAAAGLRHSPCDYCQQVVSSLEDFVADPQTQQAVAEYIDSALCSSLPSEFASMCTQEVPVLVASAAQSLQEALTPSDLCAVLGVCPASASSAQLLGLDAAQAVTPFDCPVCKMVVIAFVARLQDRQAREQIEADMRAACANLGPEGKEQCLQDVADLFRALDHLLRDVDPEGVCRVVDFCENPSSSAAPAALRTLRSAVRQLATGAPAAANSDMCDNCKTVVTEAAAILQDPKTQAELLDYAKEGCSMFQDFKDQCEAYITLYGPLVFNMLITYLQPDSLCTRIGYCPASTPLFIS